MRPIAFLLVWIGLSVAGTGGNFLFPVPNCSQVPSDFAPWLQLSTRNHIDEALLQKSSSVRTKCSVARIFLIRCWALYPISLTSDINSNNEGNIDQVKVNAKADYYPDHGLFIVTTFIVIEPQEEFHLEASCKPTCNSDKYPSASELLTIAGPNNLSKVQIQPVFESSVSTNKGIKWILVILSFGVSVAWFLVLEGLIHFFTWIACRQSSEIQV